MQFFPPFFFPGCVTSNNFSFPPTPSCFEMKGEGGRDRQCRGREAKLWQCQNWLFLSGCGDGEMETHLWITMWSLDELASPLFASLWLLIDAVGEAEIGAKWLFGSARFLFRWSQEHIQIGNLTCKGDRHGNTESCFLNMTLLILVFYSFQKRETLPHLPHLCSIYSCFLCHFNPCWCSFTCCYFLSTF